ncbi:hypothetical protein TWF970_001223 [Orbilia oligospora]|uniref:Uncharacterized protein n=1 Tax=Orbilia oligospora TaxID=2813651 RepID=A0A7C8VR94_ORBOL|nr:hypothetical protein TWF970_001223 [Orbilia oligospora]
MGSTYGDNELVDTRENITHENYHGEFQKAVMGELSQYPHTPTHIEEYDQKPQLLETFQTVWTKSPHEARCGASSEDSVISELGPHVKAHRIVKEKMKTSTNYLYGSIGVMVLNFFVGGFMWSLHLTIQRFEIALLVQEEHLGRDIDLEKIRDDERGIK